MTINGTMDFTRSTSRVKLLKIEKLLRSKPLTQKQLSVLMFASYNGLNPYIKHLYGLNKIYISGYHVELKNEYCSKNPIWALGDKDDAPKPKRKTPLDYYHERRSLLLK